jgi:2-polyprenyl-3-methyl-5-hydroxy-6-metoxy-1,4-benzoquinol methylase
MLTKKSVNILEPNVLNYITEIDDYTQTQEEVGNDRGHILTVETHNISSLVNLIINNKNNNINTICDIGAGTGFILNNTNIKEKVAIDLAYSRLKLLPDSNVKIRCNAESIPIKDNYFDAIITTDIIEHVLNPDKLINEAYRLLKPNGLYIYASPFNQDLSVYDLPEFKEKYKQYKFKHLRSITWDDIHGWCDDKFNLISHTFITSHMQFQTLKPYSIVFCEFIKK